MKCPKCLAPIPFSKIAFLGYAKGSKYNILTEKHNGKFQSYECPICGMLLKKNWKNQGMLDIVSIILIVIFFFLINSTLPHTYKILINLAMAAIVLLLCLINIDVEPYKSSDEDRLKIKTIEDLIKKG